jgi:hypothetical protein
MFRAVGHAEVQPGVVSVWHLLELFSDDGFWDGAVAGEVFGSGKAFDGDGLDTVSELGYVLEDVAYSEWTDDFDLSL